MPCRHLPCSLASWYASPCSHQTLLASCANGVPLPVLLLPTVPRGGQSPEHEPVPRDGGVGAAVAVSVAQDLDCFPSDKPLRRGTGTVGCLLSKNCFLKGCGVALEGTSCLEFRWTCLDTGGRAMRRSPACSRAAMWPAACVVAEVRTDALCKGLCCSMVRFHN